MPPGRWESGMSVRPFRRTGRARTRGSPGGGAPTSSSSGTWCARASASSSSRVGRRPPDSSRDSVLTEMPVVSESSASVSPRRWRIERSRGPTSELYAAGRAEVRRYGGRVETGRVTALARDGERFGVQISAQVGQRTVTARRLLVATGLRDVLPDVPGLAARWGIDVLHCPYCHGWEVRDQRIGILATG